MNSLNKYRMSDLTRISYRLSCFRINNLPSDKCNDIIFIDISLSTFSGIISKNTSIPTSGLRWVSWDLDLFDIAVFYVCELVVYVCCVVEELGLGIAVLGHYWFGADFETLAG